MGKASLRKRTLALLDTSSLDWDPRKAHLCRSTFYGGRTNTTSPLMSLYGVPTTCPTLGLALRIHAPETLHGRVK